MLAGLGACLAAALAAPPAVGQRWHETQGRSPAGIVALHQALQDTGSDTLALLVASHPDDRYVMPAALLRYKLGVRVAVLLASRGGGGQNSLGPESGDALERIRTLEAEAGCARFDAEVWYLNRPDGGYRRTAAETFAEWGREATLRDLVRLLRQIRPDVVITTHHAEENHGHDLALVELLPEAVAAAADPGFAVPLPPHHIHELFLGATSTPAANVLRLPMDELELIRGATLRRLAFDVLANAHLSPGHPGPIDTVLEPELRLVPQLRAGTRTARDWLSGLPSSLDADVWPGDPARIGPVRAALAGLRSVSQQPGSLVSQAAALLRELRSLRASADSAPAERLARRIDALERVVCHAAGIQIEIEPEPGAVVIAGEDLALAVRIHVGGALDVESVRVESLDGARILLEPVDNGAARVAAGGSLRAAATVHVALPDDRADPIDARFRGDRFQPPVRLRFWCLVAGVEIPIVVNVPIEQRAAVELTVVPRMLLLPGAKRELQFTVEASRNTRFPVEEQLEVRAPAGYVVSGARRRIQLREVRGETLDFALRAPDDTKPGVDVLRIQLGANRVVLPVHKIDVQVAPALRIGIVRSRDDTLPSVIGIGGFGLQWSELTDTDLVVGDLRQFDTIVVDIRALRDRPAARRSFRRLLDFCATAQRRLVVFYHKDSEFNGAGDGFRGAPFLPFQIGKTRVTRPDAPVRVLRPEHVLLTAPNRIRPSDWDGWEQERGLYFPTVYGEQYEELLELRDPGQPASRSALLYARTGDGEYVYCALSLWRQLKKLQPGSVRLLANLLTPRGYGR